MVIAIMKINKTLLILKYKTFIIIYENTFSHNHIAHTTLSSLLLDHHLFSLFPVVIADDSQKVKIHL